MTTFILPQPTIRAIDEDTWILHEKYEIEFMVGKMRYKLISAPGATSDGLSKPFFIQAVPFIGFWLGAKLSPRELPGGWAHDQLYAGEFLPRPDCDEAFLYLEWKNGVGFARRRVYYRGVRIGGGVVWDDHTQGTIRKARKYNNLYQLQSGHWREVEPPLRNVNN